MKAGAREIVIAHLQAVQRVRFKPLGALPQESSKILPQSEISSVALLKASNANQDANQTKPVPTANRPETDWPISIPSDG